MPPQTQAPPPPQARQRVLLRFFTAGQSSMIKSAMLVWTTGLEAIHKAAAPHNPLYICIALPSLERTRKGRPPLVECYTFDPSEFNHEIQLYQCFPESQSYPIHVDAWLILSDEVWELWSSHCCEIIGKNVPLLQNFDTLCENTCFDYASVIKSRVATFRRLQRGSGGFNPSNPSSSTDLQRAKSELLANGTRRTLSGQISDAAQTHNESKLQRRMTVSGLPARHRRMSERSLDGSVTPVQQQISQSSLRANQPWHNSFGSLPIKSPSSPASGTVPVVTNTYVEIVDTNEARKLREKRSTSSQTSGTDSVTGMVLQGPPSNQSLQSTGGSDGSYAEVIDPASRKEYATVLPPDCNEQNGHQPFRIAEESIVTPEPDPSYQTIASQIAERRLSQKSTASARKSQADFENKSMRSSSSVKAHPLSDQASGGIKAGPIGNEANDLTSNAEGAKKAGVLKKIKAWLKSTS